MVGGDIGNLDINPALPNSLDMLKKYGQTCYWLETYPEEVGN